MSRKRIYHIDLLRFFAALYVLFFHYCYRGYFKDGLSTLQFASLEGFSKYGYLGVDLFFIISGFVILMSAQNSDIIKFIISRFSRLYPAYWVCLLLTATVLLFFGTPSQKPNMSEILLNLTMFHGFFGIPHVDGVYWSLIIELKFYIIIGIILLFRGIKRIKLFALLLLGIAILQLFFPYEDVSFPIKMLYFITFPNWSSYFIAGIYFFLLYKEGFKWNYLMAISACYLTSLLYAFEHANNLAVQYNQEFQHVTVAIFIFSFYLVFYFISSDMLNIINKKYFLTLGVITYPLYLIHQNIGYIIINNLAPYFNKWVLLSLLIFFMLLLSLLIHKTVEKPLGNYFRTKLKQNKIILSIQSRINTN